MHFKKKSKPKSQVVPLIIIGGIAIFFAGLLAQAADSANFTDTYYVPPKAATKTISKFRIVTGRVSSWNTATRSLKIELSNKEIVSATVPNFTPIYLGNNTTTVAMIKTGASVKVRGRLPNNNPNSNYITATSIKILKVNPT